eukprot:TRINITY_DN39452_c0_g1_i1.p1 TRINITY_DN39452_c0_g1~~TRINITY_DN39452_c0_g1_i1.p1  ORF type:complete len:352 (-),score=43.44 TRINITY_DN39452_c0_g1_i1:191-1246(-)
MPDGAPKAAVSAWDPWGDSSEDDKRDPSSPHTIAVSGEVLHLLHRCRKPGEVDSDVLKRALDCLDAFPVLEKGLTGIRLQKAMQAAQNMRRKGYTKEMASALCRALFGCQSEKDLRRAFTFFDHDGSGEVDKKELEQALPLMGETVPQKRLDELFTLVDTDGSGTVDFAEFCTLVRGLNAKPGSAEEASSPFNAFFSAASMAPGAVGNTISAVSTAYFADLPGLSALQLRKAGIVLNNMRNAGYGDKVALAVCRALFYENNSKHLKKAFSLFDVDGDGTISISELKRALPLMGEDVQSDQIEQLLARFKDDSSDELGFDQFCKLVKAMNADGVDASSQASPATSPKHRKGT